MIQPFPKFGLDGVFGDKSCHCRDVGDGDVKICVVDHFSGVVQIVGFGADARFVFSQEFLPEDLIGVGQVLLVCISARTMRGKVVDPQFVMEPGSIGKGRSAQCARLRAVTLGALRALVS